MAYYGGKSYKKSYVERAIQQLYPLELSCDRQLPASQAGMNPEAAPFRPRRDAAVAAHLRLQEISQEEVWNGQSERTVLSACI